MIDFLREYIRSPFQIGAVAPSGRFLARRMMRPIDFDRAKVIVEYGPGTGAFTKQLLSQKKDDTRLILIEQNERFYERVKALCAGSPCTEVVFGSAADADRLLAERGIRHADAVVSGLPFASLSAETSRAVFAATRKLIGTDGIFITFQYTLWKRAFFESAFHITGTVFEWRNLPPAFVLVMRAKLIRRRTGGVT